MNEAELMMLSAGGDEEVVGGNCDALTARKPGKIASQSPDLGCRLNCLELLFQLTEQLVVLGALGAVPQLEENQIAEDGTVVGCDSADLSPDCWVAARSERLDPGRRIHEKPLTRAQGSSRIRRNSCCVMKSSRVPNFSASF